MKKFYGILLSIILSSVFAQEQKNLNYKLYIPKLKSAAKIPLVVALHGCKQNAEIFSQITQFDQLAEKENFAVLYPEQSILLNADHCWNWFLPFNQKRDFAEPAAINALVQSIMLRYPIDRNKVFIAGLSSGAAMANIMANCYPDIYRAVALHSGLEFAAASTVFEANDILTTQSRVSPATSASLAYRCSNFYQKPLPAIIFVGSDDKRLNPNHSKQIVEQFQSLPDLIDDGVKNKSRKIELKNIIKDQVPNGYKYSIQNFGDVLNPALIKFVQVENMQHAWSGGAPNLKNSDPKGPSASELIWKFFKQEE